MWKNQICYLVIFLHFFFQDREKLATIYGVTKFIINPASVTSSFGPFSVQVSGELLNLQKWHVENSHIQNPQGKISLFNTPHLKSIHNKSVQVCINTLVAFGVLKCKATGTTNCMLEDLVSCECLLKTALFPTASELLVIPPEKVETTNNYHIKVPGEKKQMN